MARKPYQCDCGSTAETAIMTIVDLSALGDASKWLQCVGCDNIYSVIKDTSNTITEEPGGYYQNSPIKEMKEILNSWIADRLKPEYRRLIWTRPR